MKTRIAVGLASLVALVYARAARFPFVSYDDPVYVYDNPIVRNTQWLRAFEFHASNWHPLTSLSHMLDVQLFGMNAGAHHAVNIAIHGATVVLLFFVLERATGAMGRSATIAAIWAVHPLNVESVVWISERKNVLSTFFLVATIGLYVERGRLVRSRRASRSSADRRPGRPPIAGEDARAPILRALIALTFALGLMAKPMLVTLPLLLIALDREFRLRDKWELFALSAASCAVTLFAQRDALTLAIPFTQRALNVIVAYGWYLLKTIAPWPLAIAYPHPFTLGESVDIRLAIVSGALLLAISVVVWRERERHPWLLTGWAWFVISLLPVIGLLQAGLQAHADRYAYVPMIGLLMMIPERRALTAFAVPLAVIAFIQIGYWSSNRTLYEHAISVEPRNWLAWNNLGDDYAQRNDHERALQCFLESAKLNPRYDRAVANAGGAFAKLGRIDEAIAWDQRAVALNPREPKSWINLGYAFLNAGDAQQAAPAFRRAGALEPHNSAAILGLALCAAASGDDSAYRAYRKQLDSLSPESARYAEALLLSR